MLRRGHRSAAAERLGVHVGARHVVVVGARPILHGFELVERWVQELQPGSLRNGWVVDRQAVTAALARMELPAVPAVVACDAASVGSGSASGELRSGLSVVAWTGSALVRAEVPIAALTLLREPIAAAGVRAVGWMPAALTPDVHPAARIEDPGRRLTAADGPAVAALLWDHPESWPVGLPAPPTDEWVVGSVS